MTQPDQTPTEIDRDAAEPTAAPAPAAGGTDVVVDPQDLQDVPPPAGSDPAQGTQDDAMGGTGGGNAGGAG